MQKRKKIPLIILCSGLFFIGVATAEARNINWVVHAGLDFGGDKIGTVAFDNGNKQNIYGGGMLQLGGGILIDTLANTNVHQTQLTINWKFDSSNASNGEVSWDRYPLELIQFYNTQAIRLGAGITYHLNPSVSTSGFATGNDLDFDNALGLIAEADYKLNEKSFIGIRYTRIEYKLSNSSSKDRLDGSSIGVVLGLYF